MTNRQITLAKRPEGDVSPDCFATVDGPMPVPGDGQVLVKVEWLSIDPTIRMWMAMDTYLPAIEIGAPIRSAGLGTVVESHNPDIPVGTRLFGTPGWQEYAVMGNRDHVVPAGVDPTAALSVFGITGLTAYFGLLEIGQPKEGETVVISGAAGATGSVAGQIAKLQGCTVVGIAGSDDKCRWLTEELGFDTAINYRTQNVAKVLKQACPAGIDVFFDNVGGDVLDAVLMNIHRGSRIVICGAISQYDDMKNVRGPRNYLKLAERQAVMEGFAVFHFEHAYAAAEAQLTQWLSRGDLVMPEHVETGVESFPRALDILMSGGHRGKLLVKIAH